MNMKYINLSKEDENLLQYIKIQTKEWNKNNVTRTKAYLHFFQQYPDVHWAFLGHMVSRNGGWNMTDLKGEHLSRILSNKEKQSYFSFLERGNWLIFQDAYPQFLIYRESLRKNKPLFHLFSFLNISIFMETIWNYFWKDRNKYILATALIINEQNYLEKRVVQNPKYKKEVFDTFEFKLQDILSFTHILFPYLENTEIKLAGLTLHHFHSLEERILLGKKLYAMLFQNKVLLANVKCWANTHPHTGSRKDYWPTIFNNVNEGLPGKHYQRRLISCKLRKGARRIYSPNLENAWNNANQTDAEAGDWFEDLQIMEFFSELNTTIDGEIQNEYCKTLERLELAALAKKAISILD